jgi:hypothetical protein
MEFVKWINANGFKNRQDRKSFWNSISKGQPLMEEAIVNLMKVYGVKDESIASVKIKIAEKRMK